MAGDKDIAFDFDVRASKPIDTRTLKSTFADLFNASMHHAGDGLMYLYNGLTVTVIEDGKLGIYLLLDKNNYQYKFGWMKIAGVSSFDNKILNPLFEGVNASGSGAGWSANEGVFSVADGVLTMASGGDGTWNVQNTRTTFLPKQGDAVRLAFRLNTTGVVTKTTVLAEIRYMTDGGPETISVSQNITDNVQDFVVTGIVAETKPETAVISECEVSFTIAASDGVKLSNVKLHEGEYADLKNNGGGGSSPSVGLGYVPLAGATALDTTQYKHFNVGTIPGTDQKYTVNGLEVGASYSLILHVTSAQTKRPDVAALLAASEGKTPAPQMLNSLANIQAGETNYKIQIDIYNITDNSYMYDAYKIG